MKCPECKNPMVEKTLSEFRAQFDDKNCSPSGKKLINTMWRTRDKSKERGEK